MAGIPPLIGFFSKQFVLYSALQNGYYFISIVAIIVSVISASYYLKLIQIMTSPLQLAPAAASLAKQSWGQPKVMAEAAAAAAAEAAAKQLQLQINFTNYHS